MSEPWSPPRRVEMGGVGLGPNQRLVLAAAARLATQHGGTTAYELGRQPEAPDRRSALVRAINTLRERGLIEDVPARYRPGVSPGARLLRPTHAGLRALRHAREAGGDR
ncbi:hypothetical protein [Ornithinimicrobium cavernae]|uniref:hypothetical protein n=1 Tax=Ornithinimicrobium cavernae TaxID=2666047 RepID=UPI000D68B240|nr:hypothetical protein [Ornithinimicrobium cavernae]